MTVSVRKGVRNRPIRVTKQTDKQNRVKVTEKERKKERRRKS